MTIALIDGDIVVWRASATAEGVRDWGDGDGPVPFVDHDGAAKNAIQITKDWAAAAKCDEIIVYLTPPNNFRKSLWSEYKANRKGTAKPAAFKTAQDALKHTFRAHQVDGLEADDLMGIEHTATPAKVSVIITLDKDLQTVPGQHFNPIKSMRPFFVSPALADWNWMRQTLMGDRVDGIPGIPGVGPKTAEKIMASAERPGLMGLWDVVVAAYESKGLDEDYAVLMARLTRILQSGDYDRGTNEVTLWHPRKAQQMCITSL